MAAVTLAGHPAIITPVSEPGTPDGMPQSWGDVMIEWDSPGRRGTEYGPLLGKLTVVSLIGPAGKRTPVPGIYGLYVYARHDETVTVMLEMHADENGKPLFDGTYRTRESEILTGWFRFDAVAMGTRGTSPQRRPATELP